VEVSPYWVGGGGAWDTKRFEAMVVYDGLLYAAEGYPSAYLGTYDGGTWSQLIPDAFGDSENSGLSDLAVLEDALFVSTRKAGTATTGDEVWGHPFYLLPGATASTPAVVCDGYENHLVVRGLDNHLYYMATEYLSSGGWSGNWTSIPGATKDEPALAIVGIYLHLVVRGMDDSLYHIMMDISTGTWGSWSKIPGATTSAPTLITATSTSLALVVRGQDNGIYFNRWSAAGWSGWSAIPGATQEKPAMVSDGSTLCLAVRGVDGGIYVKSLALSTNTWGSWDYLGATSSTPALALAPELDDFVIVVRGLDDQLYYTYTWHGEWSGPWYSITGATIDRPALARTSYYDEFLHLVVRGKDNSLYHNILDFDTFTWSGWTTIPHTTPTCPGVTDYYYVGVELVYQDTANRIRYNTWNSGSGWLE
jgi:hypothetical protein